MDKNLIPYLYAQSSIPDILKEYCNPMLLSRNILTRSKASQLLTYRAILLDNEFKKNTHECFEQLYSDLKKAFPTTNFVLVGRIKALLSTINKLEALEASKIDELTKKYISSIYNEELSSIEDQNLQQSLIRDMKNKLFKSESDYEERLGSKMEDKKFVGDIPFERVNDYFAFRVTLEDLYPGELIETLYMFLEFIIHFFSKRGYEFIEHSQLIETGKKKEIKNTVGTENIFIPTKDLLNPDIKKIVKDYVFNPKFSGYQGLHVVVLDPFSGRKFEIQIRTRTMDLISNTLASHTAYKDSKYGCQQADEENIDFTKIHIRGFRYIKYLNPITGKIDEYFQDTAGIKKSIPLILMPYSRI